MTNTQKAQLALRTADAYSFNRYGFANWARAIDALDLAGLAEIEIEAVLRSKLMRWAADAAMSRRGAFTIAKALDILGRVPDQAELIQMVHDTFSLEAAS